MSSSSLACCGARIDAALDYLQNEPDLVRAITLAETQLKSARACLTIGKDLGGRRAEDLPPALTFLRAAAVPPNPWPPQDKASAEKAFCDAFRERRA